MDQANHHRKDVNLGNDSKVNQKKKKPNERYYRDKLAKSLNGKTEIIVPIGRIDILITISKIITTNKSPSFPVNTVVGRCSADREHPPPSSLHVATIKENSITKDQIIKVKHIKQWKAAFGQIIAYGNFYPDHQKHIHLFD